jgi:hypothetical protein
VHAGLDHGIDMRAQRRFVDAVARFVERRADGNADALQIGHGNFSYVSARA